MFLRPDISSYIYRSSSVISTPSYLGKPSLDESQSFRLVEDSSRWRSELKIAFDSGKTIFVFLSTLQEVFVDTGKREYSGTGRNRITTSLVAPHNNYSALPLDLGRIVSAHGNRIKIATDLKFLAPYWKEFGSYSEYEVYIDSKNITPILTTQTGDKAVGTVVQGEGTTGCFVLLPPIRYGETFLTYDIETDEQSWTDEAFVFGKRFVSYLVQIDQVIRGRHDAPPPPEWTQADEYRMKNEAALEKKIRSITSKVERLQTDRSDLSMRLAREGGLRRLLYETGHQLEDAVLEALTLLGFKAERYRDTESEFDAVFTSPEGRFLGEAEGKDKKAIGIDKFSQHERNLQEDFAREEVSAYAKGVLFGNAFRLMPPSQRPEFFTSKCLSGAQRSKIALVRTSDLFVAAKYLRERKDAPYATKFREALLLTEGEVVRFPQPPLAKQSSGRKQTSMVTPE